MPPDADAPVVAGTGRASNDDDRAPVRERRKGFARNALFGALAIFITGLFPLVTVVAPVAGGALAGYLQNAGAGTGAKIGVPAGAIGGIALDVLAPPRFFGPLGGDVGGGFYLIAIALGFAVWIVAGAFGGAVGARLAGNRHGSVGRRQ